MSVNRMLARAFLLGCLMLSDTSFCMNNKKRPLDGVVVEFDAKRPRIQQEDVTSKLSLTIRKNADHQGVTITGKSLLERSSFYKDIVDCGESPEDATKEFFIDSFLPYADISEKGIEHFAHVWSKIVSKDNLGGLIDTKSSWKICAEAGCLAQFFGLTFNAKNDAASDTKTPLANLFYSRIINRFALDYDNLFDLNCYSIVSTCKKLEQLGFFNNPEVEQEIACSAKIGLLLCINPQVQENQKNFSTQTAHIANNGEHILFECNNHNEGFSLFLYDVNNKKLANEGPLASYYEQRRYSYTDNKGFPVMLVISNKNVAMAKELCVHRPGETTISACYQYTNMGVNTDFGQAQVNEDNVIAVPSMSTITLIGNNGTQGIVYNGSTKKNKKIMLGKNSLLAFFSSHNNQSSVAIYSLSSNEKTFSPEEIFSSVDSFNTINDACFVNGENDVVLLGEKDQTVKLYLVNIAGQEPLRVIDCLEGVQNFSVPSKIICDDNSTAVLLPSFSHLQMLCNVAPNIATERLKEYAPLSQKVTQLQNCQLSTKNEYVMGTAITEIPDKSYYATNTKKRWMVFGSRLAEKDHAHSALDTAIVDSDYYYTGDPKLYAHWTEDMGRYVVVQRNKILVYNTGEAMNKLSSADRLLAAVVARIPEKEGDLVKDFVLSIKNKVQPKKL